MHKSILGLFLVAGAILSGCFTREEPFYEESQMVQLPNLEGAYQNTSLLLDGRKDGASWFIRPSMDFEGKYVMSIHESEVTVELLGTIFRVGTNLFLDLFPLTDSGVLHVAGAISVTEMLRSAMYKPLHVVWKIEISEEGISYSFPYGNGTVAALRKSPELKGEPKEQPGRVMLTGTPKDAQKYLNKYKDDGSVFNFKGRLVKKKNEGSPEGETNAIQRSPAPPNRKESTNAFNPHGAEPNPGRGNKQ